MEKGQKKLQSLLAKLCWKKSRDSSESSSSSSSSSSSKSKSKSSSGRKFDDIKALCHVLVPMESLGRHRCVTQKLNDVSREVSRNFYISTDHDICHHKVSLCVAPDYLTMTPASGGDDGEEEEKRFPMQDVIGFESYERQFFLFAVHLRDSEEVLIYALRTPLTINAGELRAAFVKYATCERHHIPPPTPNVSPRESGDDDDDDSDSGRGYLIDCQRISLLSLE